MAYQVLEGVRISPKGSYNTSRFKNDFEGGSWPNSFAFGGWIYNATTAVGFNSQPTEIKIDIVLEARDKSQKYGFFDINQADLKCDAGNGGDENLFDIDFNGVSFTDMILYSYDISIENGAKILSVTFKDYSIILDKIYIGLLKRQGNKHSYTSTSKIEFPVNCTDCILNGSSFWALGETTRDIAYGSYVGLNGNTYDNFQGISLGGNIYEQWEKLSRAEVLQPKFDLNGGYLIIGMEEASEEKCGNLANVTYTFNQLLSSLRRRGIQFGGAFPQANQEGDYVYKQNYIGTLREVLQQWCSDLGYDFYCEGKRIVGINTNRAIDISNVTNISDPTSAMGQEFALNKNTAIISYRESNSLDNTFRQSVITADTQPRQSRIHTKSPKRYIGLLPMHPLDFNYSRANMTNRTDVFNNSYLDQSLVNSFTPGSFDTVFRRAEILDNRTFGDIDAAIALSHYNEVLRDIYCQDRAIYGSAEDSAANFKALGIIPILEVTDELDKSLAIETAISNGDEVSNICRDQRFYRVYIGYYYSQFKEDIVNWERTASENMYKFGAVKRGILQGSPHIPYEVLQDLNPASGFQNSGGARVTRITHNFDPQAKQYFDLNEAPFKEVLLYSGLRRYNDFYPLDLYIGEIDNDWGTTKEDFDQTLSLRLGDACVTEFQNEQSYVEGTEDIDKKFQDWNLELFRPRAIQSLDKFFTDYEGYFAKISGQGMLDRVVNTYYTINYKQTQTCSKLHVIVMTDTRSHPNVKVSFSSKGRNYVNRVVLQKYQEAQEEARKRRIQQKTINICDKPLLQELCDSVITKGHLISGSSPEYACALQDDYNTFQAGFTAAQVSNPNSRGLEISIVKNPVGNNGQGLGSIYQTSDINGDFYYTDVIEGFVSQQEQQASFTIVYPVSFEGTSDEYYRGILTSNIEIENRSPELSDIYGEPVNTANNTAVGIKIINNTIDTDLQPQLDPYSSRFLSYITVLTGAGQVLTSVSGYHNYIKNLNSYQTTGVTKTVDVSLAGTPNLFGTLRNFISPNYGLTRLSLSVNDNGVKTDMSFADKPPITPKQEAILNKIGPRLR